MNRPVPDPKDIPEYKPTHRDWVRAINERAIPTPRKGNKRTGY